MFHKRYWKNHSGKNGFRKTDFGKIVFGKTALEISDWRKRFGKNSYWENWTVRMLDWEKRFGKMSENAT